MRVRPAVAFDDPDGLGSAPGHRFAVEGLDPLPTALDGLIGEVHLPGVEVEPRKWQLREDQVLPALGLPRDLNGDSILDEGDHALDYVPLPVRVTIDNSLSDTHTVVEVRAPDRLGLLYRVTRALAAEGLDIATAKIATDLDHALDAFYVTDRAGGKIDAPAAAARLRAAIETALAGETEADARTV